MALDERVTQAVRQALGHERDVVLSARSGTAEQRGSIVRRVLLIIAGMAAAKLAFARGRETSPAWMSWAFGVAASVFAVGAAAAPKVARVVADRMVTEDGEEPAEEMAEDMESATSQVNGAVPVA
jgi:hypothetical protein